MFRGEGQNPDEIEEAAKAMKIVADCLKEISLWLETASPLLIFSWPCLSYCTRCARTRKQWKSITPTRELRLLSLGWEESGRCLTSMKSTRRERNSLVCCTSRSSKLLRTKNTFLIFKKQLYKLFYFVF